MRLVDADAYCSFLREVSTRQHYETLLTKKDRYPTVADVIEEICCDLDGTSLNGFDNAPTVDTTFREVVAYECGQKSIEEQLKGKWIPVTERLPEEYEHVLCWYEYFRYGDYNCMYETYGVGFHVHDCWIGDVIGHKAKVLAWMPLPDPYKRGGEEDDTEQIE